MWNCYIFARKLETGGILSTMFFIKKKRMEIAVLGFYCKLFIYLINYYIYNLQIIIVKHFSVDLIKIEFGTKEKVES